MFRILINFRLSSKVNSTSLYSTNFSDQLLEAMADQSQKIKNAKAEKHQRYNGMVKKRQWEDKHPESNEGKRACFNPEDRVKRRKFCLLLGYSGAAYFGMQRNPEMRTIEEELLTAMLKSKWITEEHFNQPQTCQFQRAARTDKGVSAARQCVSLKLPENLDIAQLNNELPEEIRVFTLKRVTKGFNSKDKCDARTYIYMLPTISFADHYCEKSTMETYRVPTDRLEKVNETLALMVGTLNFHNFTSKKDFINPSAKRYIVSFKCDTPFIGKDGIEFTVIRIKGQSFMLHQIRKMIGLVLAVVRGLTNADTIKKSFSKQQIDIPMAPGLGLILDQTHYDRYNNRYASDGIHESLTWEEYNEEIDAFVHKYIFPTIIDTEIAEKSIVNWLDTLPRHSYEVRDQLKQPENKDNDDEENADESVEINRTLQEECDEEKIGTIKS